MSVVIVGVEMIVTRSANTVLEVAIVSGPWCVTWLDAEAAVSIVLEDEALKEEQQLVDDVILSLLVVEVVTALDTVGIVAWLSVLKVADES